MLPPLLRATIYRDVDAIRSLLPCSDFRRALAAAVALDDFGTTKALLKHGGHEAPRALLFRAVLAEHVAALRALATSGVIDEASLEEALLVAARRRLSLAGLLDCRVWSSRALDAALRRR